MKRQKGIIVDKFFCSYCHFWPRSKYAGETTKNGSYDKPKKKRQKKKNKKSQKKCFVTERKIRTTSHACSQFKLTSWYHCLIKDFRTTFLICLNRRKSKDSDCKRCRQFGKEIEHITEEFEIKLKPRIIKRRTPKKRVIKRRTPKTRIIKRRTPKTRIIKRRNSLRKIKRR